MHVISQETSSAQSFLRNNKLHQHTYVPSLLCCGKESLSRLSRFRLFLGFCCWLTPITLTVLCVSTCSDGLLDFHIYPKKIPRSTLGLTLVRRKENFIQKGRMRSVELFVLLKEFYVSNKDEPYGLSFVSSKGCRSSNRYMNNHKSHSQPET